MVPVIVAWRAYCEARPGIGGNKTYAPVDDDQFYPDESFAE